MVTFVNAVKGISTLQLGRELNVQYKTAFVLAHKLREAMASQTRHSGMEGTTEVDGCWVGGQVRPANRKENRKDRRLAENQSGRRRCVVVVRERGGRTRTFALAGEEEAGFRRHPSARGRGGGGGGLPWPCHPTGSGVSTAFATGVVHAMLLPHPPAPATVRPFLEAAGFRAVCMFAEAIHPMSLDTSTVRTIANLARIEVRDDELAHLAGELSGILHFVEQLQELNTDGVPPMTSVAAMSLPQRMDVVTDGGYQDKVLANAPEADEGFFLVPKVVE